MAKHRLTTFKQSEFPMHEYISKFTDLVKHTCNLQSTDTASTILASNFIEGITNSHVKNKLRSYKINNLQNIITFVLQEDQKQKIRALDSEGKSDTIAQCDINTIKGITCYKCGDEGHFIKYCPLNKDNPTQNQRKPCTPYNNRSTSNTTDVITPIAQTLKSLLKQLKQFNTSNTTTHNNTSHHKSHHNNTDRQRHNHHNRDAKHNSHNTYNMHKTYCENRHNKEYHNRHDNRRMVNEIKDFSEYNSDCSDISDFEEPVNNENTDDTKKISPSQDVSKCL